MKKQIKGFGIGGGASWVFLVAGALASSGGQASEWVAEAGFEGRYFFQEGPLGESQTNLSARFEPEYYSAFNDGDDAFSFKGFIRVDQRDSERTHTDVREALWIHVADGWELKAGIGKVFWGVTESQHLVDIINQTDLVENIDGEEKLGQPMIKFSTEQSWGLLDLFVLPYFRERTFPGTDGRPRLAIPIDADAARYASGAEDHRIDVAVRYSHYIDDLEFSISHFSGTNRDPALVFNNNLLAPRLIPFYTTIDQTGLTLQYIYESWLWKLEAITRSGDVDDRRYVAATAGFEYTEVGVFDTAADLGWVAEYLFDDRKNSSDPQTSFEQDIFVGTRWTLNDADSTEALIGVIFDPETEEKYYSLEASKRLNDDWKVELETRIFSGGQQVPYLGEPLFGYFRTLNENNKIGYLRTEDYAQVEFIRYF